MNVGRKLLRLWILATAGYILLVSALMFGWVRGEFARAAFEEYLDAHAIFNHLRVGADKKALQLLL